MNGRSILRIGIWLRHLDAGDWSRCWHHCWMHRQRLEIREKAELFIENKGLGQLIR